MKKYTLFLASFVFILSLFGLFSFNVNSTSAANCAPGEVFSTSTGQPCDNTNTAVECRSGYLFSPLTGKPCPVTSGVSCRALLNRELKIGSRGEDVRAFQQILKDDGLLSGKVDGVYGPITSGASINYYRKCPKPFNSTNAPVISGVSGPQSLNVNQQGTWTVTASSPNGGNLSYSVHWGDEPDFPTTAASSEKSSLAQQSATFTHSYARAGAYTPTFTVTSASTINCITAPCPSNGGSAQVSLSVKVGGIVTKNNSPVIQAGPTVPYNLFTGQLTAFNWTATDADNDDLSWSVNWGDGPLSTTTCSTLPNPQNQQNWDFTYGHTWANRGTYTVTATVSDCRGGSDTQSFKVTVNSTR
jgi:peptidoglycan hydrolase-like protein with peptidoglycan-binding domain